jgi:alcohol dehydrogenase
MTVNNFRFTVSGRIEFEPGSSRKIGDHVRGCGGQKAFISTDKGVVDAKLLDGAKSSLDQKSIPYVIFDEVEPNPSYETVEKGYGIYKDQECDLLIGFGGGSPIDAAKAIGVMATNPGEAKQYAGGRIPNPIPPLIAVPTTAGTGSEVTIFSVITDTEQKFKTAFAGQNILPKLALLDPQLLVSLPPKVIASTGMDALTHAIEAFISLRANPMTDALALESIRMIAENLRAFYANPNNVDAAGHMLIASTLAGLAFTDALTGIVHAMAHPLSAHCGIPHGAANAVILPHAMEYCRIASPEKFTRIAQVMGKRTEDMPIIDAAWLAIEAVEELLEDVEIPNIESLGAKEEDIPKLTEDSLKGYYFDTPRRCDKDSVERMFRAAFMA